MRGISGGLISADFLERLLLPQFGPSLDESARAAAHKRVACWWRTVEARYGPASSLRSLLDGAAVPLAEALGYRITRTEHGTDLFVLTLTATELAVPMLVVPWQARLDGLWRPALRQALLHNTAASLVYSGSRLRVLDAARGHARRYLEFDLPLVLEDAAASDVLFALVTPDVLAGGRPGTSLLEQIVDASDQRGVRVCSALRSGVVRATEHMLEALAADARTNMSRAAAAELQDEAMTAVYRMLFLLFAEARALVPSWHAVYRAAYSLETLLEMVERRAAVGISDAIQAIARLAHAGCHAGDLVVTAFNGRLFSPARAPRLDAARLDDQSVRHALLAVSTFVQPGSHGRQRIAFADLGVEELGAVYEALLEYEAFFDPRPRGRTRAKKTPGFVARLERTGSARRKATGTFYTPRPLTRYLVRETLEPLVRGRTPAEILDLRICDPAMGSGAFLVATCQYLAHAYEAALLDTGSCGPTDLTEHDRAGFRRLIAQRCLFGVDLNPMAVQLARLSLWLTTLAADQPLSFLDHHLTVGDSLLGAGPMDLLRCAPARRIETGRQLPLFERAELARLVNVMLPVRHHLERTADADVTTVREKEQALASLDAHADLRRWRAACDVWCSNWCHERPLAPGTLRALIDHVLHGPASPNPDSTTEHLERVRRTAAERSFHHWALQFPEVFCDAQGRVQEGLGFDAIIGNPPWEMLRADDGAGRASANASLLRFARASGLYTARSIGHSNQYQLFVERSLTLLRPNGRFGLVIPGGFAVDASAAALRRRLVHECALDALVGFENRRAVFPIHRSTRFLLVTGSSRGRTERIRCRFGLHDPADLDLLADEAVDRRDSAFPVAITPSLLERLSGDDLAIPYVRSPLDLQIAERLATAWPRLDAPRGWHARFGRELNATDDRKHFTSEPRGLPVLEGKHVEPFAVNLDEVRFRIDPRRAARLLDGRTTFGAARLAFRDVASASNRQTVIAAILPARSASTHTLFCLKTPLSARDQQVLCCLLNSYVVNFLARQRVTTHVTVAVMHAVPVPRPASESAAYRQMVRLAELLSRALTACRSAPDRGEAQTAVRNLISRVEAVTAYVYALDPDEYQHVLSTFPLAPENERRAAFEQFMRLRQGQSR
jgi:hypothetical protein